MKNRVLWQTFMLGLAIFAFDQTTLAQQDGPKYVNAEAGWQWAASSDGITRIPVCWENAQGYSVERQWVRNVITNTWEQVANVNFSGWGQCDSSSSGIRINVADTRSHSYIGRHLNGVRNGMELNFTFREFSPSCQADNKRESCIKSIGVHEFGHALGFAHEQDRADSTCNDERGSGGGWRVTEYDPDSVMNYCNPRWNNDGQLSQKDIQGVQTIYGAKTMRSQGQVFVSDVLDTESGQVWENIVMDFNGSSRGSRQFFHLNRSVTEQTRVWNIHGTGQYCYKVWSYTMYTDRLGRTGYGEGCFKLEDGKAYSLALTLNGRNANGSLDIGAQVKAR